MRLIHRPYRREEPRLPGALQDRPRARRARVESLLALFAALAFPLLLLGLAFVLALTVALAFVLVLLRCRGSIRRARIIRVDEEVAVTTMGLQCVPRDRDLDPRMLLRVCVVTDRHL